MFINIHSHQPPRVNERCIQNVYRNFAQVAEPGFYSIGLHPWYITTETRNTELNLLEQWCGHGQVLAIGECGLDKICTTNFSLQHDVFIEQLHLANKIGKPLILHCVKAYEEILQLLNSQPVHVPVIFHGFSRQSIPLAQKITGKGYYISVGKALQLAKMQLLLKALPIQNIFLETDDAAIPVALVYEWAATAFSVSIESLSLQLQKNAARVFGSTFTTI